MIEITIGLIIVLLVAFLLTSAAGGLFALATRNSRHVRWVLPLTSVVGGAGFFGSVLQIDPGDLNPWHFAGGICLLIAWGVAGALRCQFQNAHRSPYSSIWLRAVLKATFIVAGFMIAALTLGMMFHHG